MHFTDFEVQLPWMANILSGTQSFTEWDFFLCAMHMWTSNAWWAWTDGMKYEDEWEPATKEGVKLTELFPRSASYHYTSYSPIHEADKS